MNMSIRIDLYKYKYKLIGDDKLFYVISTHNVGESDERAKLLLYNNKGIRYIPKGTLTFIKAVRIANEINNVDDDTNEREEFYDWIRMCNA